MRKKTEKIKEFLPSKKFTTIIALCVCICVIILIFASYFGSKTNFNKTPLSISKNATLGELLTQDSNNNGIPDWEETLYNLDPKADGVSNKQKINLRKEQAKQDNKVSSVTATSNTAKFSQGIVSTILALKQSGNLTPDAIASLENSLGQNIDSQKDNPTPYSIKDITAVDDSNQAMVDYAKNFQKILDDANKSGFGGEMGVVYQLLNENAKQNSSQKLDKYINLYAKFAKSLLSIKTPQSLTQKALVVINNCTLMSHSLEKIKIMYTDAVSGLIGFDEYATSGDSIQNSIPDLVDGIVPVTN